MVHEEMGIAKSNKIFASKRQQYQECKKNKNIGKYEKSILKLQEKEFINNIVIKDNLEDKLRSMYCFKLQKAHNLRSNIIGSTKCLKNG